MIIEISLPIIKVNNDGPNIVIKTTFSISAPEENFWAEEINTEPHKIEYSEECKIGSHSISCMLIVV
jgi:hypothetical protein